MERTEYETELTGDRATVAAALSGVVDGLLAGSVRVGEGDDAVAVEVPDELSLEVELELDDEERSLELELEWEAEDPETDVSAAEAVEPVATAADTSDDADIPADEGGDAAAEAAAQSAVEEPAAASDDGSDPATVLPDEEDAAVDADLEAVLPVGAGEVVQSLARFELYRDRAEEWRWRLRHRNGNVIATSGEGYTRKANAQKGLRSVVRNAPGAAVDEEST